MDYKGFVAHETNGEDDEKSVVNQVERRRSVDGVALETKYACESRQSINALLLLTVGS